MSELPDDALDPDNSSEEKPKGVLLLSQSELDAILRCILEDARLKRHIVLAARMDAQLGFRSPKIPTIKVLQETDTLRAVRERNLKNVPYRQQKQFKFRRPGRGRR